MSRLAQYFTVDEMKCKGEHCCDHTCAMDDYHMTQLDRLREECGPLRVTSGFRCNKHNADVGGVVDSWHTKGKATDVVPPAGVSLDSVREKAEKLFHEVIQYRCFVHVGNAKSIFRVD